MLALLLVWIQTWSSYLTASLCTDLRKSGIVPSEYLASPHCDQWLRTRRVDATCQLLVPPLLWLLPHVFPGLVPYLILKEHRIRGVGVLESLTTCLLTISLECEMRNLLQFNFSSHLKAATTATHRQLRFHWEELYRVNWHGSSISETRYIVARNVFRGRKQRQ